MIEEEVQVTQVTSDGRVWVQAQGKHACMSCQARQACGQSLLAESFLGKFFQRHPSLQVACPFPVQLGDTLLVGIPEHTLVWGAVRLYLLPLLALILVGAWAEQVVAWPQAAVAGAALAAMALTFVGVHYYERQYAPSKYLQVLKKSSSLCEAVHTHPLSIKS
ncbi:sigma-E factor negative regulatory protein RseC [Allopseudospirillum japonicum]|uniref:Sigma-E factor negative regulatory protein RseC n=1 Tax=Allopseudospirillum japonicum TaxID=64971 RepID=A0A1H6SFR1_9GAMM|nr:SoxR reducing system RseC family protein [Allopseudospirillum japonicum]SEI63657.1 sigma-E factor negative regulatory protein RseC [Allopseudospirillum japonicum]